MAIVRQRSDKPGVSEKSGPADRSYPTKAPNKVISERIREIFVRVFRVTVVLVVLFTTLFPLYWLLTLSLKTPSEALTSPPVWFPSKFTLDSYRTVLFDRGFARFFMNGLLVSTSTALISLALGSAAAYGLNMNFRGSQVLALSILFVRMIPPIVLAIPLFKIMRDYGLLDTYRGLILVYVVFTLPFATWMMRGFLLDVPAELEDAARIDGHSRLGAFVRIVLPLTAPGLAATSIFCFLLAWNEYLFALILTRSPSTQTMPIAVSSFMTDQYIEWGNMAATAVLAIVPVVLLMAMVQRYLVRGLTFGAVKG